MARKPGGRNNAVKHGANAKHLILRDESAEDFNLLHQSLIDEWKPTGALEQNTVLKLAQCIWIERRVDNFYYWEAARAEDHPEDDEFYNVYNLAEILNDCPTSEIAAEVMNKLPECYVQIIEKEIPRSKFDDEESWIQDFRSELHKALLAHLQSILKAREHPIFLAEMAARVRELSSKKIALDERLDLRIDRLIKRLVQLKTYKQILEECSSHTADIRGISDQRQ